MAFANGTLEIFKIADSGAVSRDISAFCVDCALGRTAMDLKTTTFGKLSETRIGGLKDGAIPVTGKWDPTATTGPDAVLSGIIGLVGAWEYGPIGSTTTNPKYTGLALCTSYEITGKVDGMIEWKAQFVLSGDVTRGAY